MTTKDVKSERTRLDPEIAAIGRIHRLISELPPHVQKRVIRYLHERYCEEALVKPSTPDPRD